MKPFMGREQVLYGLESKRPGRTARAIGLVLLLAMALMLVFMAWPYATLLRLDRAIRDGDPAPLVELVDLEAVRGEIKKKLNKDADSTIGELSDPFIGWLQEGIQVTGSDALDRLVVLPWVRARFLDHSPGDGSEGFLGQVTYAFFDAPQGFVVRIGPARENPIHVRLALQGLQWRVSAVYY